MEMNRKNVRQENDDQDKYDRFFSHTFNHKVEKQKKGLFSTPYFLATVRK